MSDPSTLLVELEHLERREREVSAERRDIHPRIDQLRATLHLR